ncbi:MAG: hypothetical protein VB857_11830, partial [Pirellulaceae bacterium]
MEIRRLILFVALSWMILIVYFRINKELFPPPPEPANQQQQQGAKKDAAADNQDQADQEQP